jgi:hypothetical protein
MPEGVMPKCEPVIGLEEDEVGVVEDEVGVVEDEAGVVEVTEDKGEGDEVLTGFEVSGDSEEDIGKK